ncbi:TolC family protein [uncultured Xylophilus sp.]|uniref:TolC family protein n=1 Tax=uncultured Xylophilus sp. TaxID=296832 RepID=UPI0025F15EEE|nr:TolC family protein [uncultured Xylophilus sp.]
MPLRHYRAVAATLLAAAFPVLTAPVAAQPAPGATRATASPLPPAAGQPPSLNLPAAAASGAAAAASLSGGPRIGLQELTDTILLNNPALLSAQRQRNTATAGVVTAGALPNPRLDFSAGNQSARLAGGLSGRVQTVGVSQLIENPALRSARVDAARAGERGSVWLVGVARNELVAQIRLRAYDVLLRQAEAAASAESLSLLEQVNSRVRARVDSGEAPRYELIKADAEIVNARSLRQTSLLQAEQAAITLNRLAAGALPTQWTLDATLGDALPPPDIQVVLQNALERNPELLALRAEVDRAQAQLAGAEAGRWPGVELRYTQSREPDIRQNVVGVSVQIPLLDRRTGPIAEAGSELERARGRLDGRRAELEQQVLQAGRALEMARLRVEALSQGAVRDAEAALRVADAAYRFGERGILDVLDAQRVLRGVRADLLTARFQVQSARVELDFLAGRWTGDGAPLPSPALNAAGIR